ncbi:MAG: HAD family hydrolase [Desulfobulbaceae bacterium]|nr:HAD family hydrolase [Desulfobulbaceae bacterium]
MTCNPNLHAVFFDFDGVIAASLEVKKEAFTTLFAPFGQEVQAAAVRYHVDNGGMPRHSKLRYCMEQIAGQSIDEKALARLVERFADLVFEAVVAAPLLANVMTTLQALQQARVPAFVVSGTPEEEMQAIIKHKQLAPFFSGVFGSPRHKSDIVRKVLHDHAFTPSCSLFIGDALADLKAAQANGLAFLGIVPPGKASIFPQEVATAADPGHQRWPQLLGQTFTLP